MRLTTAILAATMAMPVPAADYMHAPNNAGGRIVLSSNPCVRPNNPQLRQMWSELPGGRLIMGCWTLFADKVQVVYEDGSRYAYDPNLFQPIEGQANTKGAL